MKSKYLRIGQIVRSHGVRGDVKLQSLTDDPARFLSLKQAFLERNGTYSPVSLSGIRLLNDGCVLRVSGCDTAEATAALRGVYLCVERQDAVVLPKDTYFIADLIGCQALDSEGVSYGRVTDVMTLPANDVYEIDGGKLLVPALKRVLKEVDTENGRIVFDAEVLREVGLFAD